MRSLAVLLCLLGAPACGDDGSGDPGGDGSGLADAATVDGGEGDGGGGVDAAPADADPDRAGPGEVCAVWDGDAGVTPRPCRADLVCCYPCGIAGCNSTCAEPCPEEEPSCAGGCWLYP